jgi:hypothetical protein
MYDDDDDDDGDDKNNSNSNQWHYSPDGRKLSLIQFHSLN